MSGSSTRNRRFSSRLSRLLHRFACIDDAFESGKVDLMRSLASRSACGLLCVAPRILASGLSAALGRLGRAGAIATAISAMLALSRTFLELGFRHGRSAAKTQFALG